MNPSRSEANDATLLTLRAQDRQCCNDILRLLVDELVDNCLWQGHGQWAVPKPSWLFLPVSTTSTQTNINYMY